MPFIILSFCGIRCTSNSCTALNLFLSMFTSGQSVTSLSFTSIIQF